VDQPPLEGGLGQGSRDGVDHHPVARDRPPLEPHAHAGAELVGVQGGAGDVVGADRERAQPRPRIVGQDQRGHAAPLSVLAHALEEPQHLGLLERGPQDQQVGPRPRQMALGLGGRLAGHDQQVLLLEQRLEAHARGIVGAHQENGVTPVAWAPLRAREIGGPLGHAQDIGRLYPSLEPERPQRGSSSRLRSSAGAEWVSAPTLT
jgi:hypothetical protein